MPVSLLHPGLFAIGLACVSIPIILHLLKRRRRVVSWGAMRFLEEAYRKRRRIITLEQLILLSLRCLLIVLIALGVGSLMLGSGGRGSEPTTLVIVLDDSIGSAQTDGTQTALDRSKRFAIEQIDSMDPAQGDRVALISASAPATAMVMPPSSDLAAVMALIEQATPSDAGLDLAGAMALSSEVDDGTDAQGTKRVMLFASANQSVEHAMRSMQEQTARVAFDELILTPSAVATGTNIGIRSVEPTRSLIVRDGLEFPEALRIELVRSGDDLAEESSRVTVVDANNQSRGSTQLVWKPGQREAKMSMAFDTRDIATHAGLSSILGVRLGDDANPRDNTAMLALPVRSTLRVGVIDRPAPRGLGGSAGIAPSRWVRAALAPNERMGVRVSSVEAQQAGARLTSGFDALIVLAPAAVDAEGWERIARLHEQGTMLIITPDAQNDSLVWFDQLRAIVPEVFASGERLVQHEPSIGIADRVEPGTLLAGISAELPTLGGAVQAHRSLQIPSGVMPIAQLSDGSALGVQVLPGSGGGAIVVLATALDLNWTNLPTRPLFVAMMQELVRQGVGTGLTLPPILAGQPVPSPSWVQSAQPVELLGREDTERSVHQPNQIAGVLALRDAQGSVRALQVVQPDAQSAVADPVDQDSVESSFAQVVDAGRVRWGDAPTDAASAGSAVVSSSDSRSLALIMLWAALGVATLEFVLARLFTARLVAREQTMGVAGVGAGGARHE